MSDSYIDNNYENKYLQMLKEIIIQKFYNDNCTIFLFGSRARNKFRRDSDYDIGIQNIDKNIFLIKKWEIELAVEESIIPHKIDFINFDETDDNFRKYAFKDVIVWKK